MIGQRAESPDGDENQRHPLRLHAQEHFDGRINRGEGDKDAEMHSGRAGQTKRDPQAPQRSAKAVGTNKSRRIEHDERAFRPMKRSTSRPKMKSMYISTANQSSAPPE